MVDQDPSNGHEGPAFGQWVRSRRRHLLLTQAELADLAGLSVRTVRNLEADRCRTPRADTRRLVLNVLAGSATARPAIAKASPVHRPPVERFDRPEQPRTADAIR
jgi:transcriptional regulator with XRE-family HTH domain